MLVVVWQFGQNFIGAGGYANTPASKPLTQAHEDEVHQKEIQQRAASQLCKWVGSAGQPTDQKSFGTRGGGGDNPLLGIILESEKFGTSNRKISRQNLTDGLDRLS